MASTTAKTSPSTATATATAAKKSSSSIRNNCKKYTDPDALFAAAIHEI